MADAIRIDVNDLTLGELEDFETASGLPAAAISRETPLTAKAVIALVWIAKRREDPAYTLDDARNEKLSAVAFGDGEPDPTPSNGDAGGAGLASISASSARSSTGARQSSTGRSGSRTGSS